VLTERDIVNAIRQGKADLSPLRFRIVLDSSVGNRRAEPVDAIIEAKWGKKQWHFAAEIKRTATPKNLREAISSVERIAAARKMNPIVIAPYLSPESLATLESSDVSGIDLCGNGFVMVPDALLVSRTGTPNQYPQSTAIRNVYSGSSSLVARAFLARPAYTSVSAIGQAVRELGGEVSLATVSKVLKVLENDLMISRTSGVIRLLQAEKLLDALVTNFRFPAVESRFVGRVELSENELQAATATAGARLGARLVFSGQTSAPKYAVLAREPVVVAYCDRSPDDIIAAMSIKAERTDRFANLDLRQTDNTAVFFDAASEKVVTYASPVQSYLELMAGDKRQQETAQQVRDFILRRIALDRGER
jgi:hypothetical protein